jgi:hypothetical protein
MTLLWTSLKVAIRFERNQYIEVREGWASNKGELAGKTAGVTYGAEHLCRLLGMLALLQPIIQY